jgi:hypothetical protein
LAREGRPPISTRFPASAFRPPQRDDLGRRRIQTKVEFELPLARGGQRANDAAEREPLRDPFVRLLDDREIRKREERVGVGPKHGPQDAAFHQIAKMILTQRSVSREHVAERVILALERIGGRHAGETAELLLGQNANRMSARLRVQLLRPFQLVRRVSNGAARSGIGQFVVCIGCRTETLRRRQPASSSSR